MVAGSKIVGFRPLLNVPSGPLWYTMAAKFDVSEHALVPKHSKVSEKELKELFDRYSIQLENLPRMFRSDPALAALDVKEGDVVKIVRKSSTAGESVFYRRVAA